MIEYDQDGRNFFHFSFSFVWVFNTHLQIQGTCDTSYKTVFFCYNLVFLFFTQCPVKFDSYDSLSLSLPTTFQVF